MRRLVVWGVLVSPAQSNEGQIKSACDFRIAHQQNSNPPARQSSTLNSFKKVMFQRDQAVTQPATRYHHAVFATKNWSMQAKTIPPNPMTKYRSHDLVSNALTSSRRTPRISIGTQGAKIV